MDSFRLFANPKSGESVVDVEDHRHLLQQFEELTNGISRTKDQKEAILSFEQFLRWEEIQAILADKSCTMEEIEEIWRRRTQGQSGANFESFVGINYDIDDLFEDYEDEEEAGDEGEANALAGGNEEDYEDEIGDPWDPNFDPSEAYEAESLEHIRSFFTKNANEDGKLSFRAFSKWDDVLDMIKDGEVDLSCLKDVWREAVQQAPRANESFLKSTSTNTDLDTLIDLDTFLRMYIRLNIVLEEIEDALKSLSDEDIEKYYRSEFDTLTGGKQFLTYKQLLSWPDITEMIANGSIDKQDIVKFWNALPKEKVNGGSGNGGSKGFADTIESIRIDSFLALNEEIENKIYSSNDLQ